MTEQAIQKMKRKGAIGSAFHKLIATAAKTNFVKSNPNMNKFE